MTPDELALARRLVAAPGWVWLRGMSVVYADGSPAWTVHSGGSVQGTGVAGVLPDLSDPVTAASLPVVARLAWGEQSFAHSIPWPWSGPGATPIWQVYAWNHPSLNAHMFTADTEAAAWVAAIEAAPVVP